MKTAKTFRVIFFLYVVSVVILSVKPGQTGPDIKNIDKVGHFCAYCLMGVLSLMAFVRRWVRVSALLCSVVLGYILEWVQSFIPGRDFSYADGAVNTVGVVSGVLVFLLFKHIFIGIHSGKGFE